MAVTQESYDQTHERLDIAMAEYHRLRDDLEKTFSLGDGYIVLSASPKVLRQLGKAALAHAESMEQWTDDVYLDDISATSDDID